MAKRIAILFTAAALAACSLDAPGPRSEAYSATEDEQVTETSAFRTPAPVLREGGPGPVQPQDFASLTPVRMAVIWYGESAFMDTRVTITKAGTASRVSFMLPGVRTNCSGVIHFTDAEDGDWEFTCDNGRTSAGILVRVRGSRAINGQGVDDLGRSVIFSIPLIG